VALYADELTLLDTVDPQNETFYTGLIAAALLSLALEPSALEFFRAISDGRGRIQDGGLMDPVAGVLGNIAKLKGKHARFRRNQERLCESTLGAVEVWREGEQAPAYWSRGRYEPVNLLKVIRLVREKKLVQRLARSART